MKKKESNFGKKMKKRENWKKIQKKKHCELLLESTVI
jgi:hypothetical protein